MPDPSQSTSAAPASPLVTPLGELSDDDLRRLCLWFACVANEFGVDPEDYALHDRLYASAAKCDECWYPSWLHRAADPCAVNGGDAGARSLIEDEPGKPAAQGEKQ